MNYKEKTNILGFNIPNVAIYGVIIAIVLFFFGVFKAVKNFISALFSKLGLSSSNKDQTAENNKVIDNQFKNDKAVSALMTNGNKDKAEALFKAMDGIGTNSKAIFTIFQGIKTEKEMKAIYLMFGVRTLNVLPWYSFGPAYPVAMGANLWGGFTGTLTECLKNELSNSEMNKNLGTESVRYGVQTKLNWLNIK